MTAAERAKLIGFVFQIAKQTAKQNKLAQLTANDVEEYAVIGRKILIANLREANAPDWGQTDIARRNALVARASVLAGIWGATSEFDTNPINAPLTAVFTDAQANVARVPVPTMNF